VKASDELDSDDSGMPAILAIVAGIVSAAVGVVGTYLVMTSLLGFKLEPKETIYDNAQDGGKGKAGMGGMGGMKGGGMGGMKGGGMGGMKGGGMGGMKGGQGDKGAPAPNGAFRHDREPRPADRVLSSHGSITSFVASMQRLPLLL
jgi:hypothetical protein